MYGWSEEIVRTAVESVPEEILENEKVRGALEYLGSWIDQYSEYIEPHGDHYNNVVAEAELEGADAVMDWYRSMLADALHRQKMFGEVFDLEGFIDLQGTITVAEVLEEAR
jgi:hypothetical protein